MQKWKLNNFHIVHRYIWEDLPPDVCKKKSCSLSETFVGASGHSDVPHVQREPVAGTPVVDGVSNGNDIANL